MEPLHMERTAQPQKSWPKFELADLNQLPLGELFSAIMNARALEAIIELAVGEDLAARGDITSTLAVPADATGTAQVVPRREGVLAGGVLLERIARKFDPALQVQLHAADGADLQPGEVIATLSGPMRSILSAERTMLNFLTYLSGVATLTSRFVEAVTGENARIYDTRKTMPGLRRLGKYAVRCGGGYCHRIGLHDAVLIKDNHLARIPSHRLERELGIIIADARRLEPAPAFVEIEIDSLDQLEPVLRCDVDIVLLDNMPVESLSEAVAVRDEIHPSVELEASGGVSLGNARAVAETGVDRIAVGALTHSAPGLDIGLDVVES